jgi:hypothetical protein
MGQVTHEAAFRSEGRSSALMNPRVCSALITVQSVQNRAGGGENTAAGCRTPPVYKMSMPSTVNRGEAKCYTLLELLTVPVGHVGVHAHRDCNQELDDCAQVDVDRLQAAPNGGQVVLFADILGAGKGIFRPSLAMSTRHSLPQRVRGGPR